MKLIIEDDEGRRTVVPFNREEITIGRHEGNTIRLTERNVSRRHARFVRQNGHILVEDVGSSYGIQLNGIRLSEPTPIKDGDLVQIGDYDLALQPDDSDDEPTALRARPTPSDDGDSEDSSPGLPGETDDEDTAADEADVARKATLPALPITPVTTAAVTPESDSKGRQSTAVISLDAIASAAEAASAPEEIEPDEAPRLVVLNTPLAGRELACIRTVLTVGRTDDNDIALDHPSLSRTHAKLVRDASGEWKVVDLQSANGIKLNGEKYGQAPLLSGDVLELGHVKLKFLGPGVSFRFDPRQSYEAKATRDSKSRKGLVFTLVVLAAVGVGGWFWWSNQRVSSTHQVVASRAPHAAPSTPAQAPTPSPQVEQATRTEPAAPKNAQLPSRTAAQTAQGTSAAPERAAPTSPPSDTPKPSSVAANEPPPATDEPTAKPEPATHSQPAPTPARSRSSEILSQASAAFKAGHADRARHLLSSLPRHVRSRPGARRLEHQIDHALALQARAAAQAAKAARRQKTDALFSQAKTILMTKHAKSDTLHAKSLLTQCVHLDPHHADCHMLLGTAYAKLGDSATAAEHYRKFVQYADMSNPFDKRFVHQVEAQLSQYHREHP